MTLHARLVAPTGEAVGEFVVTTFPARIGRDPMAEIAVDEYRFPVVSGLHAQIDRAPDGLVLTAKSPKNLTLHNDCPVGEPVPLRAGDRVRLGVTGPTVEVIRIEAGGPDSGPAAGTGRRAVGCVVTALVLLLLAAYPALVLLGVVPNPLVPATTA
jgi:pSer/pThr/pTyr-binding forkhead associated (FHA) protein